MQDWINQHPQAVVAIGVLGFLAAWILIANLVALMSGWSQLAARFRLQGEFPGPKWSWQSAQMRWGANYNNCLTVGADQTGLFLHPMILFRSGHPPLFVPWSETTFQRTRVFLVLMIELRLGRTEQVPFRIRPALAAKLEAAAGPSWHGRTLPQID